MAILYRNMAMVTFVFVRLKFNLLYELREVLARFYI